MEFGSMRYVLLFVFLAAATIALLLSRGTYKHPEVHFTAETVAPGRYQIPPLGIDSVKGECVGKIALTPQVPEAYLNLQPYPVVYDCASKTFEVLERQTDLVALGDLTLTKDGYYLHQSKFTNDVWVGGYYFYGRSGNEILKLPRPDDPKYHSLIVREHDLTYLTYFHDWDAATCSQGAPFEFEIVTEDLQGSTLWKWKSKDHFKVSDNVATAKSMNLPSRGRLRNLAWSVRHCYTTLARRVVRFDPPAGFLGHGDLPIFELEENDYVHVNSLQWVGPSDDMLISARHFDTIYLIDKQSGQFKWALGGPFALATSNRPVGDPRGGFSHAYAARLVGNMLWVMDNGNLFRNLPSRVVAYQIDSKPQPYRMAFEFIEPNQRQRYTLGSIDLIDNNHLLIGWGAVNPEDMLTPQRALSIVRLEDHKEIFSIDLSPGWITPWAKAYVDPPW
jgi:Arylsulfotransferase (ASST)